MQSFRPLVIATIAATLVTTGAEALTLAQGAQPAETPPASYSKDVYIDSRGCAYVRAGVDGRTNWVPRVTRARKVVCGLAPTFAREAVTPSPPSEPAPAPISTARVPASLPGPAPAPAPVAVTAEAAGPAMPEGYRSAWDDDRLNPNRGPRTAAGDAQMAAVWDNNVPMSRLDRAASASTTLSTMSAPRRAAESGGDARFIQAASFADPANARRTADRMARLGLPVRVVTRTRGGKLLRLVQAGPFASGAELTVALTKVRGLGFADAFTVK